MKKKFFLLIVCLLMTCFAAQAQVKDSSKYKKTYTDIREALKDPLNVYRLNLSDLPIDSFPIDLSKFKNLEYLCLDNDHLEFIPREIENLQNLKVLHLSGDDFKTLPPGFSNLKKLEELYLNVNKKMDLTQSVKVLSTLPNLRVLHLENDGLVTLPSNFNTLTHLQKLYLNNNKMTDIPVQIKGLKNLKYVDMQNNDIPAIRKDDYKTFGFKVNF